VNRESYFINSQRISTLAQVIDSTIIDHQIRVLINDSILGKFDKQRQMRSTHY